MTGSFKTTKAEFRTIEEIADAIAKGIDSYRESHPHSDLTVGEIIEAFRIVRNELNAAAERQRL